MNSDRHPDADEHARNAGGSVPDAADLPPAGQGSLGRGDEGRDIEIDGAAGGGLADPGEVRLHAGDEGLREVPAGEGEIEGAAQDFMDIDRSRHA